MGASPSIEALIVRRKGRGADDPLRVSYRFFGDGAAIEASSKIHEPRRARAAASALHLKKQSLRDGLGR
jgi:hypothetical protein